jgi:periplasmic copper chaperone A
MKLHAIAFTILLAAAVGGNAQAAQAGQINIDQARARPTVNGQASGAAYVRIENKGKAADKLLSVSSPVAQSVEIHTMAMEGNLMKMREVSEVDVRAQSIIDMQPGAGYHIMLMGLRQPLKAGDKFPLTLVFEKAGKAEVNVEVGAAGSSGTSTKDAHGSHAGHSSPRGQGSHAH